MENMTHKVTIELTEEQVEHFRDRDFLVLTEEQKAQILPKPQKKWRFYKGAFCGDAARLKIRDNGAGQAYICPDYSGPDAYCFTKEQFKRAVSLAIQQIQQNPYDIEMFNRIPVAQWLERFLSQQEEK